MVPYGMGWMVWDGMDITYLPPYPSIGYLTFPSHPFYTYICTVRAVLLPLIMAKKSGARDRALPAATLAFSSGLF